MSCCARAIESDMGEGNVTRKMWWTENDLVSINGKIESEVVVVDAPKVGNRQEVRTLVYQVNWLAF